MKTTRRGLFALLLAPLFARPEIDEPAKLVQQWACPPFDAKQTALLMQALDDAQNRRFQRATVLGRTDFWIPRGVDPQRYSKLLNELDVSNAKSILTIPGYEPGTHECHE